MVDYRSSTQNEPTRQHVIIQSVDTVNKLATGQSLTDSSRITINLALTLGGQMITWPRQSEEWYCVLLGGMWALEYKAQFGNEGFQQESVPGDIVLATDGNIVLQGNNIRLGNSSTNDILSANQRATNTILFGGPTRSVAPTATVSIPGSYTVGASDAFVVGISVVKDTDAMVTAGTSNASPSFVTVPVAGRYTTTWHTVGTLAYPANTGGTLLARISLNAASATSTLIAGSTYYYASGAFTWGEVHVEARRDALLNAGDKLYFSNFSQAGTYTVGSALGLASYFQVRYIGQG